MEQSVERRTGPRLKVIRGGKTSNGWQRRFRQSSRLARVPTIQPRSRQPGESTTTVWLRDIPATVSHDREANLSLESDSSRTRPREVSDGGWADGWCRLERLTEQGSSQHLGRGDAVALREALQLLQFLGKQPNTDLVLAPPNVSASAASLVARLSHAESMSSAARAGSRDTPRGRG